MTSHAITRASNWPKGSGVRLNLACSNRHTVQCYVQRHAAGFLRCSFTHRMINMCHLTLPCVALQQAMHASPAAALAGRRLLFSRQQQQQQLRRPPRHNRRLHGAASMPYIASSQPATGAAATARTSIPTVSPEMGLQEMLCAIQPYSPTRLQGMRLPAGNSSSSSRAIACRPPQLGLFQHGRVVFRPIVVPIVFHGELQKGQHRAFCRCLCCYVISGNCSSDFAF